MTDPQANYLINTAQELQDRFVNVLKNMAAFSQLSDEQLRQLFRYSKFVKLADQDRPIKQGGYDQIVYILIQGRLTVFMKLESGEEERLDVIFKPFSLVGTQCILGEPRTVSIEASGEVLLIGIDVSLLSDIIDGFENPDTRLVDTEYIINRDIFTVFAAALVERLNRRVKDQYKLCQRADSLKASKPFQKLWRQNLLATTLFNQFCRNELSPNLDTRKKLQKVLDPHIKKGQALYKLIHTRKKIDTEKVYIDLIRAEALGKIQDLHPLLVKVIKELVPLAGDLGEYSEAIQYQFDKKPDLWSFTGFLNDAHEKIAASEVTAKPLKRVDFLEGFLVGAHPNPPAFATFLQNGGWVNDHFSLAYIMFLICQSCLLIDLSVNKQIGQFIQEIILMGAPRQNTQFNLLRNFDEDQSLAEEVVEIYESQATTSGTSNAKDSAASDKKSVNDLLAEFDM